MKYICMNITENCTFTGFPRNLAICDDLRLTYDQQHQMLARRWLVREGCRITAHLQLMLRQNLRQFLNKHVYKYLISLYLD